MSDLDDFSEEERLMATHKKRGEKNKDDPKNKLNLG